MVDEEPVGEEPLVDRAPVVDQEGYEQEVAGPEMAGQAMT